MGPLYVREVVEGESADRRGVQQGDEIMLINDTSVTELNWEAVESVLKGGGTIQNCIYCMDRTMNFLRITLLHAHCNHQVDCMVPWLT